MRRRRRWWRSSSSANNLITTCESNWLESVSLLGKSSSSVSHEKLVLVEAGVKTWHHHLLNLRWRRRSRCFWGDSIADHQVDSVSGVV